MKLLSKLMLGLLLVCSSIAYAEIPSASFHVAWTVTNIKPVEPLIMDSHGLSFYYIGCFMYVNPIPDGSYFISGDVRAPADPNELMYPLLNPWLDNFPTNSLLVDAHGGGGPDPERFIIIADESVTGRYPDAKGILVPSRIQGVANTIGASTNTITTVVLSVCNADRGLTPKLVQKYFPKVTTVICTPQGVYGETTMSQLQANPYNMETRQRVVESLKTNLLMILAYGPERLKPSVYTFLVDSLTMLTMEGAINDIDFDREVISVLEIEALELFHERIGPLHKYTYNGKIWIDNGVYHE